MTSTQAPSRTTPAVRKVAARLHVNVAAVTGTGIGGRVTVADVKRRAVALSAARVKREQGSESLYQRLFG